MRSVVPSPTPAREPRTRHLPPPPNPTGIRSKLGLKAAAALLRSRPRWQIAAAMVALLAVAWFALRPGARIDDSLVFAARRGPLDIKVLVGGNIEALSSQEIRSEVRGEPVKILRIIDEGYQVTEEDVRTNKVMIELDASKIKQNLLNEDITFQSTISGLTEAQQAHEIQLNQNRTDIKAAEQKARFALMEFEKYVGASISKGIIDDLDLNEEAITNELAAAAAASSRAQSVINTATISPAAPTNPIAAGISHSPLSPIGTLSSTTATPPAAALPKVGSAKKPRIDFSHYAQAELLEDGAAKQELRKREDELLVAKTALSQAQTKLDGTKRLFERGFVTKNEMENDQIAADQARLKVEASSTARNLFFRYEFPKQAEELLSKYDEALQGLIRSRKEAISKLAQAEARLRGAEGRYDRQKRQIEELNDQVHKAVITAKTPGLVVYGGNQRYWREERIAVGAQVYERQQVITIPDPTKMGVTVGVHESHIKKVKKGQRARITADAFPDDPLDGEVTKVGVIPDSENRWMNPDLKLYQTTIAISTSREWLKPGMSCKIEILVKRIPETLYIPFQSVVVRDRKQVVFRPGSKEPVEVTTGEYTDEFIEITKGLKFNDLILLRAPDAGAPGGANDPAKTKETEAAATPAPPAPTAPRPGG